MAKNNNLTDYLLDLRQTICKVKGYAADKKINPQDFAVEIASISGGDAKS